MRAVAQSLSRRVERISSGAAALADALALFPAGAGLADAAPVAGLSAADAATAADALIDAGVLAEQGGRLEFLHPLLRSARYLQRALDEGAASPGEERSLRLDLGRLQRLTGDPGAQATLATVFAGSRGTPDHARAAIELAGTAFSNSDTAPSTAPSTPCAAPS
jgi:hypothetical protein